MHTVEQIKAAQLRLGHKWFTKPFDLNVIVIRNAASNDPDHFNDELRIIYNDAAGITHDERFPCTSHPGLRALLEKKNPNGVAIFVVGQQLGSHRVGLHKGRPSLVATRQLNVWRDGDKDGELDPITLFRNGGSPVVWSNGTGMDIHSAHGLVVGNWSEGCIAVLDGGELELIKLVALQEHAGHGDTISLTVLDYTQIGG